MKKNVLVAAYVLKNVQHQSSRSKVEVHDEKQKNLEQLPVDRIHTLFILRFL